MSSIPSTTATSSRTASLLRARIGTTKVLPYVAKSWERCLHRYGIEPDADRDTAVLGAESLRERQQRFGSLLDVARAEMENLYEQITGSGYAVILSDADAVVLSAITDPNVKREFRQAGLWLGAIWSEDREGTNGLGTCIAEGGPVMVYRDEHFRRYNATLACSGAPIHDVDGSVLAVLDASSAHAVDARPVQRHTMALVSMSANLIARCHFLDSFNDAWVLRFHSRAEFVGLLHEALLAVDEEGIVVAANESAMVQLGISSRARLVGQPVSSIFPFEIETLRQRASEAPGTLWPIRDIAYGRRFFAVARAPAGHVPRSVAVAATPSQPDAPSPPPARRHVGSDPRMQRNLNCGRQLFGRRVPLLLQGATGTGKEAFAKALHRASAWAERPFVAVNCAAIPESLIESELFGYTRGAFTDAAREGHVGKIRQASGGTLFLDEIGDMPLALQTRLLRVLEEHEIVPLGGSKAIPVDLHVISATYHDLLHMVQDGRFREDLYYRLNGITLHLPPLSERTDKRELIDTLLREECGDEAVPDIDPAAMDLLLGYAWPGNIRQLRNTLRTAAALCQDQTITADLLPPEIVEGEHAAQAAQETATPLRDAERDALIRELERMHWNISRTAETLGISRNTLYRKIRKHEIVLPD
ncbi:sigma-54-dependent Fis family transcriptional regulator [Oleiagrimonas soli]|uniref:ATPase AAA n=1 Tax=Oleiagrimonas soli TaxID=1543381 RepID=A0A099D196_9GAMM|nr:sigma-54-dependent Fis family transcriptional regulator [Oleiagrimonas soli]KGI79045.1 ATPase AAA [Oleiagrimonas soli]MBB6184589.1 transcriptional regulator of acetoin/glycerol metabolism [Oleiagrimonas soli]